MVKHSLGKGFTIVELLVVIVVIGVLAAITIVSYSNISQRANIASLQSDLTSSAKQLKMFKVDKGAYPTTIDCGQPDSSTNKCLKASPDSAYTDYQVEDQSNPQSFSLTETRNGISYTITDDGIPIYLATGTYWKQIWVGFNGSCGVASDNQVRCWGYNSYSQLGDGGSSNRLTPVNVNMSGALSGKTIKYVAMGYQFSCGHGSDNKPYCWGYGWDGQLGNGSTAASSTPVAVTTSGVLSGKTIKQLAAGRTFACVIASDNQAYCWGINNVGQLGNNSTTSSSVPVAVNTSGVLSGKTIKSIFPSLYHTCVIASDDQAYCWGYNTKGQLGNNSTAQSNIPVAVNISGVLSGKTIKSLSSNYEHTCVIASDNQAYCWGDNSFGQLGNNSTTSSSVPVAVNTSGVLSGKTIKSIAAGSSHTCVIASDDQVYCWGDAGFGQLGNNSTTDSLVPIAIDTSGVLSGSTIKSIRSGYQHLCVLASDSKPYCWGINNNGQIGDNSSTNRFVPTAVANPF